MRKIVFLSLFAGLLASPAIGQTAARQLFEIATLLNPLRIWTRGKRTRQV